MPKAVIEEEVTVDTEDPADPAVPEVLAEEEAAVPAPNAKANVVVS